MIKVDSVVISASRLNGRASLGRGASRNSPTNLAKVSSTFAGSSAVKNSMMNITCRPKVVPKLGAERSAVEPAHTLPQIRIPRSIPRPSPDHVVHEAYSSIRDPRVRLAIRIAIECGAARTHIHPRRR